MLFLKSVVTFGACICIAFAAPIEEPEIAVPLAATVGYRLPTTILPKNYNLTIRPFILDTDPANKRFTFEGEVFIEIEPSVNTRTISLHSKNLKYSLREYWAKSSPAIKNALSTNTTNTTTDIVDIELNVDLTARTSYILHFLYTGTMDDDMHGFYRSSYVNSRNQTKWLGSTQLQSHHARRVFPSFDEPKFKATFDVTLIRHKSLKSVSNTRLLRTETNGEYIKDVYQTTPVMSTYLLAFIISEFNERSNGDFGVLARPEFYDQTEYSFDVGQDILVALGNYFDLPYNKLGNDKMDMAAIPDFSAGAMENWGLLTYRERGLLYEDSATTLSSKQYIAGVVSHEQTHQWFGDYVTCDWWSYAWLNEGFARYFQYFGTALVEKIFEMDKQFTVDQVQSVMGMDSTNNTNPMSDENTNTPSDLSRMFNSVTYNKGGSFIRMIAHTIGEANFQKSLQEYLKTYAHKTAVPENILESWKANWPATTKPHADNIFQSFTRQVGYPVVSAILSEDGKTVEFSQKRFLLKQNDGSDPSLSYTVPITYTTSKENNYANTTPKFVLPSTGTHKETLSNAALWVIANIQESGYYRVNYTEKNWHGIHEALTTTNWGGIHELNRAQIVDDLLNLARASELSYDLALAVLEYLETETSYLPWTSAFNGFNYLTIRLGTDTAHFGNYIRQLTTEAYNKLGFEEKSTDGTLDIYLRTKVLSWTCKFGNSDCISKAKTYFKSLSSTPVPKNIRSVIYCVALREGGTQEFDTLFNKFKTETVATEETLLQTSFGCVKSQNLIERVFNLVLSNDIRKQDKSSVLSTLYTENNENVTPVFKLVTDKFEELAEALGGYSSVASVISNIASRFTEESQRNDLVYFNRAHGSKFEGSASTLTAAERTVAENLEWANNKLGTFKSYLARRNSSATLNSFTALTLILVAILTMLRR